MVPILKKSSNGKNKTGLVGSLPPTLKAATKELVLPTGFLALFSSPAFVHLLGHAPRKV